MSSLIYPGGDHQVTPNLGLGLWGTDEVTSDNFILIDAAIGALGALEVNGAVVPPPANLVNSPTVTISVVSSNITFAAVGASNGASNLNVVKKTSNYNAVAGDFIEVDTSGGPVTITLPLSSANARATITVKKISTDSNVLTIACSGSDTIDTQATQTTTVPQTAVESLADGVASWRIY